MAIKNLAICVGDNCVDHYLAPIDQNFAGGNALNVAVAMQKAGCPTSYLGFVGNDTDGEFILEELQRHGVDHSRVKKLPGNTACTQVRLSPDGDRQFIHEDLGPIDAFILSEEDIQFIEAHCLLHTTFLGGTEDYLERLSKNENITISLDYSERSAKEFIDKTIRFVDIAFFSLPEDSKTTMEALARQIYARGPKIVVVTQGRLGSLAFDGTVFMEPATVVDVVDTLGAGDAYIGTFLAYWLLEKPIQQCMELATRVAGQTCTHFGGF